MGSNVVHSCESVYLRGAMKSRTRSAHRVFLLCSRGLCCAYLRTHGSSSIHMHQANSGCGENLSRFGGRDLLVDSYAPTEIVSLDSASWSIQ
eukprot:785927-Amphidinium_carterae.1